MKLMSITKTNLGLSQFFNVPTISSSSNLLNLRNQPLLKIPTLEFIPLTNTRSSCNVIVCGLKGPRPRYPRVWKTHKKIGTISKSKKLVDCIKGLSNVKEEVYGALDAFIAWELEFPLITVKKALKTLEDEKEWKRVIQVTKWMLSKGQGRTMGSNFTLLNALAEEDRLEEVEELWKRLFAKNLETTPRMFYEKMIVIYYTRGMHDKMFDVFADMEELGVKPTTSIVSKVGNVFQKLGMMDKYEKLHQKYPPPQWEYRFIKGKRVKVPAKPPNESPDETEHDEQKLETRGAGEAPNDPDEEIDQQPKQVEDDDTIHSC
ncbi:hypothetical protein RND81_14G109100 [Saponaria officinalis]|uniref:Pentatricopeptide repeat-containing protein n=1 Tax=Saponaria officinalis TaxID=3572 RepID=A0AAW1GKP4_SAPOF